MPSYRRNNAVGTLNLRFGGSIWSCFVSIRGAQRIGDLHPIQLILQVVKGVVADVAVLSHGEQFRAGSLQGGAIRRVVDGAEGFRRPFGWNGAAEADHRAVRARPGGGYRVYARIPAKEDVHG